MKNIGITSMIFLVIISLQACNSLSYKSVEAKNSADSASYMIGISVGYSLKNQKVPDVNAQLIAKGIQEVLTNDSALSMQEANNYLNQYFSELQMKQAEGNEVKGQEFLKENKSKAGVVETESGLQYKVIEEGTGASPSATDRVKCHYEGRLLNGDVFDSSYERGDPAEFSLQGVIRGWTEGLQLMKEGGKYELYIPSELAYGPRGGGQIIGPNETLVFVIELLEILPASENE
jgi:FKBP-type peptidyl-prolyl cis-trans isomerase